ncbi:MAG: riboflavin synthase [bacterium]|nr:riboflavin synthase [bacterium]
MFTGLIEDIGQISEISNEINGKLISVETNLCTDEIKIGDSISINGACQTVIKKSGKVLTFEAMRETIERTCFNYFKKGDFVNLERAMSLNSRLDGHLVSGHIDCTAKLLTVKEDGLSKIFQFGCDTELIVEKGSVAINGISLTVSKITKDYFEVSVLPHTFNNTNLKYLKQNDLVNIEYDMVGKYIKKFTASPEKSKITKEFLLENGF